MSWILKLYETYENCFDKTIDQETGEHALLLPICHTTQNAQIHVAIDEEGNYVKGEVVKKEEAETVIVCTEDSASRSGKYPVCHPLFDKLQYVAGDYTTYGGEKGEGFHRAYILQLSDWCNSEYANEKVRVLLRYLKKGTLIKDLVDSGVLVCDKNGKLLEIFEGGKGSAPEIFKVCTGNQSDAFVRFSVLIPNDAAPALWEDKCVSDDYIQYYINNIEDRELCYITGRMIPCSEKHPSKIRYSADKAKLISSNDTSGFTYRGRFKDKEQAVSVGFEVSQKAHNALKWLIAKQGKTIDGKVFLAWGAKNQSIPEILEDSQSIAFLCNDENEEGDLTNEEFAVRFNRAISGYKANLDHSSDIIIIVLDAATTGRLAITFYREMRGDQFIERIENWHRRCSWKHEYKWIDKKRAPFIGAPSPRDIAYTAYGSKANEKLVKATIERVLPCIVDGLPLPKDLVDSAVRRASNPVSMELWEWNKTLTIACALYRRNYKKEEIKMSLDESITDRSYLFGRMLAVADQIENASYDKWGERTTNAMRYMNVFSQKPFKTWTIIAKNLVPYQEKLGVKGRGYGDLINEIASKMNFNDYKSDKPLDGLYLLGYYCQKQNFLDRVKAKRVANNE